MVSTLELFVMDIRVYYIALPQARAVWGADASTPLFKYLGIAYLHHNGHNTYVLNRIAALTIDTNQSVLSLCENVEISKLIVSANSGYHKRIPQN